MLNSVKSYELQKYFCHLHSNSSDSHESFESLLILSFHLEVFRALSGKVTILASGVGLKPILFMGLEDVLKFFHVSHLYTTFSTLATKVSLQLLLPVGNSTNLGVSHHFELIKSTSNLHGHLVLSYLIFCWYSCYLCTEGWRAESTLSYIESGFSRYWTQDLLHEGPLLYQLSYPGECMGPMLGRAFVKLSKWDQHLLFLPWKVTNCYCYCQNSKIEIVNSIICRESWIYLWKIGYFLYYICLWYLLHMICIELCKPFRFLVRILLKVSPVVSRTLLWLNYTCLLSFAGGACSLYLYIKKNSSGADFCLGFFGYVSLTIQQWHSGHW